MSSSSNRNRMSLGLGSSPLSDASGRINRRTSFGGKADAHRTVFESGEFRGDEGAEIKKDRRAMLDEWRRTNRSRGGAGHHHPLPPSSAPAMTTTPHGREDFCTKSEFPSSSANGNEHAATTMSRGHSTSVSSTTTTTFEAAGGLKRKINSTIGENDASQNLSNLSALDRYRLRKNGQAQATTTSFNHEHNSDYTNFKSTAQLSTSCSSSSPPEDEEHDAVGCKSSTTLGLGTPSRLRSSLGGAQRRVSRRTSLAPMNLQSNSSNHTNLHQISDQPLRKSKPLLPPSYLINSERECDRNVVLETLSSEHASKVHLNDHSQNATSFSDAVTSSEPSNFNGEVNGSVDVVVLQSRVAVLSRRNEILEREKMELSMAMAPMEARQRQTESAWTKERERLIAEYEKLQSQNIVLNERCSELEMKADLMGQENRNLSLTLKALKVNDVDDAKDSWGERRKINNEINELRKELIEKTSEIKNLSLEKVSLESEVFGCKSEMASLERDYDALEKDYQELQNSKAQNTEAEIQLQVLTTEHTAMTAQLNATCADLEEIKARAKADIKAKDEYCKNVESKLLFEISVLKSRVGQYEKDADDDGTAEEDPAILKARIEEKDRRITDLEEKLLIGEQQRRVLHNRIQELRGNIRVYVRTRPFLPNDGAGAGQSSIDIMPDGESLTIQGKHVGEEHAFKFDKVFAPSTGQDVVFDEVSEFVQSALDGYHVCLFSYGQTGSGKTHTMQGSGYGAMRGIIPRAVEQILSQAGMMKSQRWTFTLKASFLEIYNEELRDLLVMVNSDGSSRQRDTRTAPKLAIKRNLEGKSYVEGINKVDIDVTDKTTGIAQLEAVMAAASRARSVATTKMNAQSSRSHSVFMLHLCGSNEESGTIVEGALNLCDLAGSERLDRSGAASDAQRLKETQAINKSLSCLGDVFTHLANGSKHVPFRNSKLTYLLQDCLSGDGKALMFVNLSPTLESSNESLCSLRFAQRVNQVELGKATKHVQYGGK